MGKDCGWRHPKASAARELWKEEATEVILEILEDRAVGRWLSVGVTGAPGVEEVDEGKVSEGEEGGSGPP